MNSDDLFRETTKIVNSKENNKKDLLFMTFDITDIHDYYNNKNNESYLIRRNKLDDMIINNDLIKVVELLGITKDNNIIACKLDEMIENGYEGLMLNYINSNYEFKRTKNILKVKKVII